MISTSKQIILLFLILINNNISHVHAQQQQQENPMTINGGSVMAMAGKDCIAIAVDKRFGRGGSMIQISPKRGSIYLPPGSLSMVAFTGFEGHIQSLRIELSTQIQNKYNRYHGIINNNANNDNNKAFITPRTVASLLSHILYRQRRYYVEPIVVGLEEIIDDIEDEQDDEDDNNNEHHDDDNDDDIDGSITTTTTINDNTTSDVSESVQKQVKRKRRYRPYLCSMDMLGAKSDSSIDFVCSGVAYKSMMGTAEALYESNLSREKLLHIIIKAFLSALERDCISGYGAIVYIITSQNGIIQYDIDARTD